MSALAGQLTERVTLLVRDPARDDLGGAAGAWRDGDTVWAGVRPAPPGPGDDAGALPRWVVTLRAGPVPERLRWRGRTLAMRRATLDPATPDRLTLLAEEVR